MGLCTVRLFQYTCISNKMQRYTFYYIWKLHISGGTSTYHQERIQLYLQHLVFVTPLLLPSDIVEELELCSISWQVHGTVLKIIPLPSLWYSAQDTGVQINVLSIRKCVASKSVETTRRHKPECLILHVQCCENLKIHILRI
jgi:hypothetical protein